VGGIVLHADLPGSDYKPLDVLFQNLRPDIAIVHNNSIHLLDLTICHEMNIIKFRDYKLNKYASIRDDCKADYRSHIQCICLYTVEVSSLCVFSDIIL